VLPSLAEREAKICGGSGMVSLHVRSLLPTEVKIGIRRFMKLSVFLLLFSAIGGAAAQKALVEVGRMRLDFGRHNPREFGWLRVDEAGNLYFSSDSHVLKFRPGGQLVREWDIRTYGFDGIGDLGVTPNGKLIVAATQRKFMKTGVLIFDDQGTLLNSFELPNLSVEKIEVGGEDEILLAAYIPSGPTVRTRVHRLRLDGTLVGSFGEKEQALSQGLRARNPRLAILRDGYLLLEETGEGLFIKRFARDGHEIQSHKVVVPSLSLPGEVNEAMREYAVEALSLVDFFSALHSEWLIIAGGSVYHWKSREGGRRQSSLYAVHLVSANGHHVQTFPSVPGILRAIGRDGTLYFVRNVIEPEGVSLEVIKAVVR
jgi:hypothetical protein